jgi:hypothetical protein
MGGGYDAAEYKWIEWVRFPRTWRPHSRLTCEQDICRIAAALDAVGQFHSERDDDRLILYGYRS